MAWSNAWSQGIVVATQWWWLPLGLVGLGVVAALGLGTARLGAPTALGVVIAALLGGALVLDVVLDVVELDWRQPVGLLVVVAGVVLSSSRG